MMPVQLWFNALVLGGMYSLLALGLGLIFNTTRLFDFSYGAIYVVGAYAAYGLISGIGLALIWVVPLASVAAAAVGMAVFHVVYRPLIKRDTPFLGFAIGTLGMAIIIENVIGYVYSPVFRTLDPSDAITRYSATVAGVRVSGIQLLILVAALLAMVAFYYFFTRTRTGLSLRAVSSDARLADIKGIPRLRSIYMAFSVGYLLVGVAAILITLETRSFSPAVGQGMVVIAIVGVLLGGAGNTPAAALGGFILAIASYQVSWWFGAEWSRPVVYTLLILILLVRPQGIMGRATTAVGR